MKKQKLTYSQVGDNYATKDPIKKLAQKAARETASNLEAHGFQEISASRGETAYVWKQGDTYMVSVVEGLGTKNLVADEMRKITGKTYYDFIGHDTVATIINDLISVGATPLVIHAYWAVAENSWLEDKIKMEDFIRGWKSACDLAGVSWGGGETPTLKGVIIPGTVDLAGSAVGIVKNKKRLITDEKLKCKDRILFLTSSGINCNGLSLARAIVKKLPKGYAQILPNGKMYGEELLNKTNIYVKLLEDLFQANIDIHYIANITGHGLRKLMRAHQNYTYVVEKIFEPSDIFVFMQKHAELSDFEMYQTFNMGMDYAIFLPEKEVEKAQQIIKQNRFVSLDGGFVKKGKRQVMIKPLNLIYKAESLDLR